jgi:acyl carrier protein phosphodiesterase
VNFVAHAVVAHRERAEPAYAFGAMVPDLLRLARRAPLEPTRHGDVVIAGVAAHHRADAVFHDHPTFKAWMATLVDNMPAADRGARAAAHVAVELLVDGVLLDRGDAAAYDHALAWAGDNLDGTWAELVARMRIGDIVVAYRSPDGVAERVAGIMQRRPRLARLGVTAAPLAHAVRAVEPAVRDGIETLVTDVSERSLM